MTEASYKDHWEQVYNTKQPNEVSWTQDVPATSLNFIHSLGIDKTAAIIDVGGGDSKLVSHLLEEGYENITVLDISEKALARAQQKLGDKAARVRWIVSDITDFKPDHSYNVWHDRAAFHFLTSDEQITSYLTLLEKWVTGYLIMGTFSENGPQKCSGLNIRQYSENNLQTLLSKHFQKMNCITEDHTTPFNTTQNFLFCSFKKTAPDIYPGTGV